MASKLLAMASPKSDGFQPRLCLEFSSHRAMEGLCDHVKHCDIETYKVGSELVGWLSEEVPNRNGEEDRRGLVLGLHGFRRATGSATFCAFVFVKRKKYSNTLVQSCKALADDLSLRFVNVC